MFPPIEESVLLNNPKFAALHKTLTTKILNQDGSSKNLTATDREATTEILQAQRIRATKSEILRSAVTSVQLKQQTPALPADLVELIIILSLRLSTPAVPGPAASLALLTTSAPYDRLQEHLPRLGALVSAHLHGQALGLSRLVNPSTNASFLHRTIPRLPAALDSLAAGVASQTAALEQARLALVPRAARVLERYRTATEVVVRILEQNKHGQLARSDRSRSELLRAEAKQEEVNATLLYLTARNTIYSPEVNTALSNYKEHLRGERARLRQRQRDAERELERYGVGREGKEKVMREIARVYGEMGKQIREVSRDVERLKDA